MRNFRERYFVLYDKLEAILSEFGVNNAYGQGDYYLEPAINMSRGLGFEVCNDAFITEPLLFRLQGLLTSIAPNWEFYLRSDNFDYGIFVSTEAIRLHRENDSLLPQL